MTLIFPVPDAKISGVSFAFRDPARRLQGALWSAPAERRMVTVVV